MQRKKRPKTSRRNRAKTRNSSKTSLQTSSVESPVFTIDEACAFFGGSRPIDRSTYYRGAKAGRYPKPISIGPNISRVFRSACESALSVLAGVDNAKGAA
jgi:predicted DNA-binding transcriptional regulator AlpA